MTDEIKSELSDECGHHCGVVTSGLTNRHVGHCSCGECHGRTDTLPVSGYVPTPNGAGKPSDELKSDIREGFGD